MVQYVITWKREGTEEFYGTLDECYERINTLEEMGYKKGIDFTARMIY